MGLRIAPPTGTNARTTTNRAVLVALRDFNASEKTLTFISVAHFALGRGNAFRGCQPHCCLSRHHFYQAFHHQAQVSLHACQITINVVAKASAVDKIFNASKKTQTMLSVAPVVHHGVRGSVLLHRRPRQVSLEEERHSPKESPLSRVWTLMPLLRSHS